jgi:hypothetical protein
MLVAGGGNFGSPEEGERSPFEAATKQRLVKTKKKTVCAVVTVTLEYVTHTAYRSYL